MKPISIANLSVWGYIGCFILFNLPYVGTPALIICALFAKNPSLKSFARALLILSLIGIVLIVVIGLLGFINFGDIFEEFYFEFSGDQGTALVNNARYFLGV